MRNFVPNDLKKPKLNIGKQSKMALNLSGIIKKLKLCPPNVLIIVSSGGPCEDKTHAASLRVLDFTI